MTQRMIRAIGTSIGVALALAGCGSAGTEDEALIENTAMVEPVPASSAAETEAPSIVATTISTTAPTTALPTTAVPTTAVPTTAVPTTAVPNQGLNPLGGNAPEDALMPNVLCMNLQEAQDEIQDHGVFFSRSEDATGEGRMQLNDSNWQVVAQIPDPATPIGEGEATLWVVKFGEQPNPC